MKSEASRWVDERRRAVRRTRSQARSLIRCGTELIERRYGEGSAGEIADLLPRLLWTADIPVRGSNAGSADAEPVELLFAGSGRSWDIGFRLVPGLEEPDAGAGQAFARRSALRLLNACVPRLSLPDEAETALTLVLNRFDRELGEAPGLHKPGLIALEFAPARAACALHIDLSGWNAQRRWHLLADFLARSAPRAWREQLAPMWRSGGILDPIGFGVEIGQDGIRQIKSHWRLAGTAHEAELVQVVPGFARTELRQVLRLFGGGLDTGGIGLETRFAPDHGGVESALLSLPAAAAGVSPANLARAATMLGIVGPAPLIAYAGTRAEPVRIGVGYGIGMVPRLAIRLRPRCLEAVRSPRRHDAADAPHAASSACAPPVRASMPCPLPARTDATV